MFTDFNFRQVQVQFFLLANFHQNQRWNMTYVFIGKPVFFQQSRTNLQPFFHLLPSLSSVNVLELVLSKNCACLNGGKWPWTWILSVSSGMHSREPHIFKAMFPRLCKSVAFWSTQWKIAQCDQLAIVNALGHKFVGSLLLKQVFLQLPPAMWMHAKHHQIKLDLLRSMKLCCVLWELNFSDILIEIAKLLWELESVCFPSRKKKTQFNGTKFFLYLFESFETWEWLTSQEENIWSTQILKFIKSPFFFLKCSKVPNNSWFTELVSNCPGKLCQWEQDPSIQQNRKR